MKTGKISLMLSIVLALGIAGCTHLMELPKESITNYPARSKFPLSVTLVLSPELKASKWEQKFGGDTWRMPLGESIARNAEDLAKHLFTQVDVATAIASAALTPRQAVLIPSLKAFEQSSQTWAWQEATSTAVIEWVMQDGSGKVIWADTVRGEAKSKLGSAMSRNRNTKERAAAALSDAFRKTFDAMSAASEIQKFAAQ